MQDDVKRFQHRFHCLVFTAKLISLVDVRNKLFNITHLFVQCHMTGRQVYTVKISISRKKKLKSHADFEIQV